MTDSRRAYLGLGSNEGDRLSALQAAVDGLGQTPGVTVTAVSPVYETEPVGGPPQEEYLNAVVAIDTDLSPRELLIVAKRLESDAGREPGGERWGPRPLDVDILLVGHELVNEADLVVPHQRLFERHFVLAPLADLDPELAVVPRSGWRGVQRTTLFLSLPATQ
jgi:2-amino-4-hydroxy-6-hydroxymethyldihydropteridine diphosphokinase